MTVSLSTPKIGARSHYHLHTAVTGNVLTAQLTLRDGTQKTFTLPLPNPVCEELAARGLKAVLAGRLAGLVEGADLLASFDLVAQHTAEGHLGEAPAKRTSAMSELGQALVHLTGKTPEEVRTLLAGLTMKQKHALRRTEKVVAFLQSRPRGPEQLDLLASVGL